MAMNAAALKEEDLRPMTLLFYAKKDDPTGKRLFDFINAFLPRPGHGLDGFETLDDLSARLRLPLESGTVAILFAADRKELERLQALRDILRDIHVILVVPDLRERTVELAHRLLPSFLSTKDGDFADIEKVLAKLAGERR
jgi:hypothetical protein